MTDPWRPLPIPMLPANDERGLSADAAAKTISTHQLSENADNFGGGEVKITPMMLLALDRARAERQALAMMEKAKAMMVETEAAGLYQKPRSL